MEKREKVKMIRVDMLCDVCGDGHMCPTIGVVRDKDKGGVIYWHQCDNCLATASFDRMYPYFEPYDKKR